MAVPRIPVQVIHDELAALGTSLAPVGRPLYGDVTPVTRVSTSADLVEEIHSVDQHPTVFRGERVGGEDYVGANSRARNGSGALPRAKSTRSVPRAIGARFEICSALVANLADSEPPARIFGSPLSGVRRSSRFAFGALAPLPVHAARSVLRTVPRLTPVCHMTSVARVHASGRGF